ncbi:Uncharacterised protein [Cedecea neteri]|uniref:Uncharacterized protein n=1 Tax=Cedecea neteri TaxID=158822 RepID=A0A2X3JGC1_9ENTR|nr:Uncharacterised protein [Cedecea neteri]
MLNNSYRHPTGCLFYFKHHRQLHRSGELITLLQIIFHREKLMNYDLIIVGSGSVGAAAGLLCNTLGPESPDD